MWINYQQLQYFREIARVGSISRASEKLSISSPALSMQLKSLEELLGDKLFLRKSKRLILTDFGEYVLEYAEKIFSTGEELLSNINQGFQNPNISIGINSGLPKVLTHKLIIYILENFPKYRVHITEGDDEKLVKDLLTRECDLILSNSQLNQVHMSIESKFLYKSDLAFFGTHKFEKLKKNFPTSLESIPLIVPSLHSNLREIIDEWYLKNKLHYKSLVEIHDSASKKLLAQEGYGLVVLSKLGADQLVKLDQLVHIGDLNLTERYYGYFRRDELIPKDIVNTLIDQFKNIMT
jgi:LysR family transcriptional activator of nhaA